MRKNCKSPSSAIFAALFCILLIIICGCGGSPRVHGTITFDNGELLKTGTVVYESQNAVYYADVQSDGSYSMGVTRDGQGIPVGRYNVYFQNAHVEVGRDEDYRPIYAPLLDSKFYSADTSELTCTVKGSTRLDIQVTAPGQ